MRLGFDAKRLYSNFTGLGNYSRTLLTNLAATYPGEAYFLYAPRVKTAAETQFFLHHPLFKTRLPTTIFKPFWRSFSIKQDLKKDNIELYHGLSHEIPFNVHKTRLKTVVTIHDLIFKIYPETYRLPDRKIYDLKCRYACLRADKIIAISASTKKDIIQYYKIDPAKIEVIPPAGNPLYFNLMHEDEIKEILKEFNLPEFFLLSVGSIIERKNLLGIVRAYQFISKDVRIPCVVVGQGKAYKNKVQDEIRRTGLETQFIWIENADDRQLQALYRKAQMLIYPSFYEGFGLPVVEALLSRTPVITSNVSSLPEAGGPASWYVDPNDPAEIAAGIERILTDEEFQKNMIETGFHHARQQFGAKETAESLMKVYRKILHL